MRPPKWLEWYAWSLHMYYAYSHKFWSEVHYQWRDKGEWGIFIILFLSFIKIIRKYIRYIFFFIFLILFLAPIVFSYLKY